MTLQEIKDCVYIITIFVLLFMVTPFWIGYWWEYFKDKRKRKEAIHEKD